MQQGEDSQLGKALCLRAGRVGFEAVGPNPKLKLLEQVRGQAVDSRELRVDRRAAARLLAVECTPD